VTARGPSPGPASAIRVRIRVRPGSARPGVGGQHDGALVVRVQQPAVDSKATEAALAALATALGVPRRDVTLVTGATSRTKVAEVRTQDEPGLRQLVARLLAT
jgi:uncharacterized protein YggU (UPF0235/DUF167 family)